MYKIIASLTLVLVLIAAGLLELVKIEPTPTVNSVLAEKSSVVKGGQMAVLIPNDLSNSQHALLNKAYAIAKADGHKDPEVVQGILLQETHAGALKSYRVAGNRGDEYFGLLQIKLAAARDVMSSFPALWSKYKFHTQTDDELKANLILNNDFNLEVGSKYLRILQTKYKLSGRELVNAYNRGPGGVKAVGPDFHYALGAEQKLAAMKSKK